MKRKCITLLLGLFLLTQAAFSAVTGPCGEVSCAPDISLMMGGTDLSGLLDVSSEDGKLYDISWSNGKASLFATTNPDPFVDYGFSVKNLTASALDVHFIINSPYVGGPYNLLRSSHTGSVTDSSNGVVGTDAQVIIGAPDMFVHTPVVDGTKLLGTNPGCIAPTGPGGSDFCGTAGLQVIPILSNVAGIFGVDVHFTVSPGDIYTLNGRVELLQEQGGPVIPEPASMALLGSGLLTLAFVRYRRRK
jgi:hypothetical protein